MGKSRSVWAVSSGQYSDFTIDVVFEKQEDAEVFAAAHYDRAVHEFKILDALPEQHELLTLSVRIFHDRMDNETEEKRVVFDGLDPFKDIHVAQVAYPRTNSYLAYVLLRVEGVDIERVRKTYSERKALIRATFDVIIEEERRRRQMRLYTGPLVRPPQPGDVVLVTDQSDRSHLPEGVYEVSDSTGALQGVAGDGDTRVDGG